MESSSRKPQKRRAARRRVRLYRAVRPAELVDIQESEAYHLGPGNIGKYFYPTFEQARTLAERFVEMDKTPYVVTSGLFSIGDLPKSETALGEGEFYFIDGSHFPVKPVEIEQIVGLAT